MVSSTIKIKEEKKLTEKKIDIKKFFKVLHKCIMANANAL